MAQEFRSIVPKAAPRTGFRKKTPDAEEAAVQVHNTPHSR